MTGFGEWMESFGMNRMRFGLENITELLKRLGDPQNDFRSIHVAGSDGKGSTCAMIYSILLSAGADAGLYTSPHLMRFNERISVNGRDIDDDALTDLMDIVRPVVEDMGSEGTDCTFFEVATALALLHFSRMRIGYVVLETGMGGRLDATNTVIPEITAITNISLEHADILGDTRERIAFEKAGIIKGTVPVVTANSGSVLDVIKGVANTRMSPVIAIDRGDVDIVSFKDGHPVMRYKGNEYRIGIPGRFQAENAAIAIECAERMGCSGEDIRKGLRDVRWHGRMEYLPDDDVILDVSHTAAGAERLAEDVLETYGRVTLIIGMFDDKDADGICRPLSRIADRVIVTAPGSERAMSSERLAEIMGKYSDDVSVAEDIGSAMDQVRGKGRVLVTGSLFMAGEARAYLTR